MKLPVVSGSEAVKAFREAVKAFRKVGYEFDEQHGSHMILRHADPPH
jgi:predicted RNA binding protein YcfA (HicA-like mRNA interferase family)